MHGKKGKKKAKAKGKKTDKEAGKGAEEREAELQGDIMAGTLESAGAAGVILGGIVVPWTGDQCRMPSCQREGFVPVCSPQRG